MTKRKKEENKRLSDSWFQTGTWPPHITLGFNILHASHFELCLPEGLAAIAQPWLGMPTCSVFKKYMPAAAFSSFQLFSGTTLLLLSSQYPTAWWNRSCCNGKKKATPCRLISISLSEWMNEWMPSKRLCASVNVSINVHLLLNPCLLSYYSFTSLILQLAVSSLYCSKKKLTSNKWILGRKPQWLDVDTLPRKQQCIFDWKAWKNWFRIFF